MALLLVLFLAVSTPLSTADSPVSVPVSRSRPEVVRTDVPGDGNLWARGVDWKARFGADGVQFAPFLGSHAPRNYPLGLALESASHGSEALLSEDAVAPRLDGSRVVYDRGGIAEIYELRPREVEQLFLVPSASSAGDLVVRMTVDTELAFAGVDADGLRFDAPDGLGGVRYGLAVAIDAAGRRIDGTTVFESGTIELRVPAASLAGAAFPVTVDPVITTLCPACSSITWERSPDVSYDTLVPRRWAIAYEEEFSSADSDVTLDYLLDNDPLYIFGGFEFIDLTFDDWRRPRVANNGAEHGFLVVAERDVSGGSVDWDIAGRLVSMLPSGISTGQFAIQATSGVNETKPDVGGSQAFTGFPLPPDPTYFVVWEHQTSSSSFDIRCRTVTHASPPVLGTSEWAANSVSDEHDPAVSNTRGFIGSWGVVWVRDTTSFALPPVVHGNVEFRQATLAGLSTPTTAIDATQADDQFPDVATDGGDHFLVAFERATNGDDVMVRRVDGGAANTPLGSVTNLSSLASPGTLSAPQSRPTVDFDGCAWSVSYMNGNLAISPSCYTTRVFDLTGAGGFAVPSGEGHVLLGGAANGTFRPRIASRQSSAGLFVFNTEGRLMTVWDDAFLIVGGSDGDVHAATHAAGDVSLLPTACGTPAPSIGFDGAPTIGGYWQVDGNAAQGGALVLVLGLPGSFPLCPPACTVGVAFPFIALFTGGAVSSVVPCDPTLIGGQLAYQEAEIGPPGGAGGCLFAPLTVLLSDTVLATFR